jgi:hypothetical protein
MPSPALADTIFGDIVQELPPGLASLARRTGAFSRSRAIRNPEELLRAVLLYCGLDYSLREVAANFTQARRRLSDEAVRRRLSGCERWLEAVIRRMLPGPDARVCQHSRRLVLVDGTCVQAPGATSPDYRLHLGWDWLRQRVAFMLVTDRRTPESLDLYDWEAGDVAVADSGYTRQRSCSR